MNEQVQIFIILHTLKQFALIFLLQCKVEFFQSTLNYDDALYSVSLTINDRLCYNGVSDVIIRLRGTLKDSPLILYRDLTGKKFK